jgi:hypothetical protein
VVLLIVVGIWLVVLVPPYLRNRREWRPSRSVVDFQAHLSSLERTTPSGRARQLLRPTPITDITRLQARRRRQVVLAVLASVDVIGLSAMARGGGSLTTAVLLVALGLTALDVHLLLRRQRRTRERQTTVLQLPLAGPGGALGRADEAHLALPQSASG